MTSRWRGRMVVYGMGPGDSGLGGEIARGPEYEFEIADDDPEGYVAQRWDAEGRQIARIANPNVTDMVPGPNCVARCEAVDAAGIAANLTPTAASFLRILCSSEGGGDRTGALFIATIGEKVNAARPELHRLGLVRSEGGGDVISRLGGEVLRIIAAPPSVRPTA